MLEKPKEVKSNKKDRVSVTGEQIHSQKRNDDMLRFGKDNIVIRRVYSNNIPGKLLHWHNEIEFIHVISPEIYLYAEDEIIPMYEGDTAILLPGVLHDTYCQSEGEIIVIQLMPHIGSSAAGHSHLFRSSGRVATNMIRAGDTYGSELKNLCYIMLRERNQPDIGSNKLISGAAEQLYGYIERICSFGKLHDSQLEIEKIASYIDTKAIDGITLTEAAKVAGYSESYFSYLFHKTVGSSFKEYLTYVRMRKALQILQEGKLTISETAAMFGYGNVQNFSRAFKKVNYILPSKYKP